MANANRLVRPAAATILVLTVLAATLYALRPQARHPIGASLSLAAAMAADTAGFARATTPRRFVFPADHGPHPRFATEWWYFTGNVSTAEGRRFGYELTFFRKSLAAAVPARASAWAADQAYMAHLALTDAEDDAFHAFDRFARAAAGLAGARTTPLHVWLYDWKAESLDTDPFPMRITASAGDIALDLILEQGKPPVLHGEAGLSRKGPEPGNASYYYSLTNMPTRGTIRAGGRLHAVQGASWMDREWSTSALSQGIAGWDWFALQLDDGTELMLYQLRREEGGAAPHSAGSFIGADGDGRSLSADAFSIEALAEWRSPIDGTRYPARWRVRVPQLDIELAVSPVLAEQELNLAVRYWEGAVDISGTRDGRQVTGVGYVELTGYTDTAELSRGR